MRGTEKRKSEYGAVIWMLSAANTQNEESLGVFQRQSLGEFSTAETPRSLSSSDKEKHRNPKTG